ncbi:hypothetical protein [Streptomyces sp. NPDC002564]|uniref:hypothetical protein n=1 Tax=Streptomyces sp. NPDC002564 TaxID=3364649 RepID=UPI0036AE4081
MHHAYARSRRGPLPRRPAVLVSAAAALCLALPACDDQGPQDADRTDAAVRESHPRLLDEFRAWARDGDASRTARHARALATVELTEADADYDVELKTDLTAESATAKKLAGLVRTWWDGDDGDAVARDLVLLDARGERLTRTRL